MVSSSSSHPASAGTVVCGGAKGTRGFVLPYSAAVLGIAKREKSSSEFGAADAVCSLPPLQM